MQARRARAFARPMLAAALALAVAAQAGQIAPVAQSAQEAQPVPPAPGWRFHIDARALDKGQLAIELTLRGFDGPLLLCVDMHGASKSLREVRAIRAPQDPAPGAALLATPLARDPDRNDCFSAAARKGEPLEVRYQVDLADLARHHGDPDWASRAGDDYVFNDESVLLHPDPLPNDAPIAIDFALPDGVSVAAPWKPGRDGAHFESDAKQYDAGSYVAIGKLHPLRPVESHGGRFEVVALGQARRGSDKALQGWIDRAAGAVGDFYGGVPTGRALVVLVPVEGESGGGVFGSTLHRATPSAVLFFGADAPDAAFADDWMATHELFHIGNPRLTARIHWFNEGSATYYQDVLRGRIGMESPAAIWGDLYDGFRRFCDPQGGRSLAAESLHLHEWHSYTRLYWGAACLFFRADVLIREHSGGKRSLDDLLLQLLHTSMQDGPLDEDDLLEALDAAVGKPFAREQLGRTQPESLDGLYQKLGIVPIASDKVRLDESAPEAVLRCAILEPTSPRPGSSGSPR